MRLLMLTFAIATSAGLAAAGDWTGSYLGAQAGLRGTAASAGGGAASYGVFGGYDVDFGGLVLGGELEYQVQDPALVVGGVRLNSVGRLKMRAGSDFGAGLAYAILGGVNGDTALGRETGVVYGLGLQAAVSDRLNISGEALRQVIDDFAGSGSDLQNNSFNVRVSFRF